MAFTKITAAGIGSTETVTLDGLSVINDGSFGGNLTVGGVLTYEDVTNVDSVGVITARAGVLVGSGITLSKDGDGFFTGIVTATSFVGSGAELTGVASTENIRTNTNAAFLQNISVVGTSTVTGNIVPSSDSATDIGTNSVRFQNAYVDTYYGDGSNLTGIDASTLKSGSDVKAQANASGIVVTGIMTATKGGIGIGSTTYSGRVAGVSTVVGTIQYDAEVNKVVVFTKALQWQGIHEVGQLPQLGLMGAYNFFMPNTYSDFSNTEQVRCASAFFSRYDQAGGVNQSGDAAQYCTNSGGLDNGPYINYVGRTDPSNHFFYLGYSHTNLKYDHTSYSCWYRGDNSVGNGSWYTGTTLLGDTRNSVAGNFGFNSAGKIAMHINNNSAIEYTGSKTVNDNTWHCLGFTSTPSTLKLFVDGELMTSEGNPGYHNNLYLDAVGGNYNYTDMVPERMAAVAMWNRELTEAEMKQAFLARNFNSMGNDFVDIKNN